MEKYRNPWATEGDSIYNHSTIEGRVPSENGSEIERSCVSDIYIDSISTILPLYFGLTVFLFVFRSIVDKTLCLLDITPTYIDTFVIL